MALSCTLYEILIPRFSPFPIKFLKRDSSLLVVIMRISFIPISIKVLKG